MNNQSIDPENHNNKSEGKTNASQKLLNSKQHSDQNQANIPRNVNYYSHFLKHQYITGKDIEFVLKLRGNDDQLKSKLNKIPNQPFNVYYKKNNDRDTFVPDVKNVNIKGSLGKVEHLMRRRLGPTPTLSQVEFETQLRGQSQNEKLRDREKGWSTVPYKQKKGQFPELMIKFQDEKRLKQELKTTKNANSNTNNNNNFTSSNRRGLNSHQFTRSAFDGFQNYKPYDYKSKGVKNLQEMKHLYNSNQKMSTVQWETNLRQISQTTPINKLHKNQTHN